MKISNALWTSAAAIVLYLLGLYWAESKSPIFMHLPRIAAALPWLMAAALASYALRYLRWQWLLRRAQDSTPAWRGWLAYLAGFAFTATPGKVGELARIRYFLALGVSPSRVLAAFIFERAFDLLAIVLLAALGVQDTSLFVLLLTFVAVLLAALGLLVAKPRRVAALSAFLRCHGHPAAARIARTVGQGLKDCSIWLKPLDILVAMLLGLLAWGLSALSFVWLLAQLDARLAFRIAIAIYPTAMLAGAASMLPGGIGTTEVTLVTLLALNSMPITAGTLAAVAIRVSSLWFAVFCGFLAIATLERGMPHSCRPQAE